MIILKLFSVIPDRFFIVLASPARELYAHVLFLLYDLYRQNLYGIPREVVIDCATSYLEQEDAEGMDALLAGELEEAPLGLSPREKANALLRKLQASGWVDIETRTNYEQYVTLADYAIKILDVLDRIRTQRQVEYQGYVYGTYAALNVEDVERQGSLALEAAFEQTEQLVRELKSLHHNIKRYTEKLLKQKRPQDILAAHFLDYQSQVLDRSYHQLKTSDNVSKYRPRILQRIDKWLRKPRWIDEIVHSEVKRGRYGSQEEAEEEILRRLRFIQNSYLNMDDLLDEIDRRNAQYAKASLEQIRYLLNSSKDTEGQLRDLLVFMARQIETSSWQRDDALPEDWNPLFGLQSVETLEDSSLYTPRQARRAHQAPPLEVTAINRRERSQAVSRIARQIEGKLTYQRINEYVLNKLGDRSEVRAAELSVEDVDDFVKLIYVAAYSGNRRARYIIDFRGETVRTGGGRFQFKNVTIRRK